MANNIKQITSYNLKNKPSANTTIHSTMVPSQYEYVTILEGANITKIGYCCEPKGIGYPIFLKFSGGNSYKEFVVGKTGMFEAQPETWKNLNDGEEVHEEYTSDVVITGIKVPKNIIFTLDYVQI